MNNVVHLGDCMDGMAGKPDNYYDLAVVDPPYGIGVDKKNNIAIKQSKKSATESRHYGTQAWDNKIPDIEYFLELFRVSKNQIIWGVNYYPYPVFGPGRIYWNKCVTMPTYSDGELAYCSLIDSVKSITYRWHGMLQGNMKNKETRIHPTQKPVALYAWTYKNYAKPGWKILDTHVGSGSNRVAAHDMGFWFEGWEIDPDYHAAQEERYQLHVSKGELFDTEEIQEIIYEQQEI